MAFAMVRTVDGRRWYPRGVRLRLALAPLVVLALACAPADEGSVQPEAQALAAATEELATARAALEADRTAMVAATKELAELRTKVEGLEAKLAALEAERTPRPMPTPEPSDVPMSVDPSEGLIAPQDPLAAYVRCEAEGRCKLERAYFETLVGDSDSFIKQARIVPHLRDEVVDGYKLYGIRRGSLAKSVGLKNGDLVREINGEALGGMDDALKLFAKLRHETKYELTVERKGVPLALTVEIVESLASP
jgi:hypothetical protein